VRPQSCGWPGTRVRRRPGMSFLWTAASRKRSCAEERICGEPALCRVGRSLAHVIQTRGSDESCSGRIFSLARRSRFRQLLRSLPRGEELGMGDLLAGGRVFQLDHRALDTCADHDPRSQPCAPRSSREQLVLGIRFRSLVGTRWPHLRPHHAICRSAWPLRWDTQPHSAH
jgi:hypothetical protein